MVGVSGSVNLPLHHKVQKFPFVTSSPEWSRKKGRKMVVCVCVLVCANSTTSVCQVSYLASRFAFACMDAVHPEWAWDVRISPIHFQAR